MNKFPTPRLRRFLWGYTALWTLGLPVAIAYLFYRARRDPLYAQHLAERFGFYQQSFTEAVWVHAVSLGELRSAVPLIRRLLADGERVVTTHFTPAARREAEALFADSITSGHLRTVWVPLEFRWTYQRFFSAFSPRFGLVMEIEIWPEMIRSAHRVSIPLYACNAQYPDKSFTRDKYKSKWRLDLFKGLAGAFVKSDLQRERFYEAGCPSTDVTGELRFDQPVPQEQVTNGQIIKAQIARPTLTITSVVKGEDETYIALIKATRGQNAPLFIYVPRAPERFDETFQKLIGAGFKVARRSELLGKDFTLESVKEMDVFLGDSMGEMYAYLAMCDAAIIGGSFAAKGAHNISEPLALGKPVIAGPHTWTIEFPMVEALAAGAAQQVATVNELIALIRSQNYGSSEHALAFFATQQGSIDRTMAAIRRVTPPPPE